ncbi:hypothetical protein GEMRC1_008305 [Eukaryota sp. GEM-RC1]
MAHNALKVALKNSGSLSEWIMSGMPKLAHTQLIRQYAEFVAEILSEGHKMVYLVNASTNTSTYLFPRLSVGKGPIVSAWILPNGFIANRDPVDWAFVLGAGAVF